MKIFKQPKVPPILLKVIEKVEQIEILFLIAFIILVILRMMRVPSLGMPLLLILSGMAAFFFLSSYKVLPDFIDYEKGFFFQKLSGMGSATSSIGIAFNMLSYPGSELMLISGIFFSVFGLIMAEFVRFCEPMERETKKTVSAYFLRPRLRLFITGLLATILYISPQETLIDIGIKYSPQEDVGNEYQENLSL